MFQMHSSCEVEPREGFRQQNSNSTTEWIPTNPSDPDTPISPHLHSPCNHNEHTL